ncbi:MAG: hypothetical protein MUE46_05420 [Xanthomonadales bacterium]|jgi:hypothetical protein|nr:hypothetical protein [Xanthomonadales bacterium]
MRNAYRIPNAVAGSTGVALLTLAAIAGAEPTRFHPEALRQQGRISLTPAFTPDGNRLYFAQSECAEIGACPQRLHVSQRLGDRWSPPQRIPLGSDARVDWPSVSTDGRSLLFSWAPARDARGMDVDFDLYRLDLTQADARPIRLQGVDLQRERAGRVQRLRFVHNETQPLLSGAGQLYFWTERLDGAGGRDSYRADPDGRGGYLSPVLLPAPINTRFDDSISWIDDNARTMLLSSNRPGTLGESDLYLVRCENGRWSAPVSLGEVVNSRWNDFGPRLTPDGLTLVYTSTRPFETQDAGLIQIWSIPVAEVPALAGLRDEDQSTGADCQD